VSTWPCVRLDLTPQQLEDPHNGLAGEDSQVAIVCVQQQRLTLGLIKRQRLPHNTCSTHRDTAADIRVAP
jgi:hypothetical protein